MMVTLYRHIPTGTTRYVTITDRQPNLFGLPTLTVSSGPDLLSPNWERHYTFSCEQERISALEKLVARRRRAGYTILYSYFRGSYPHKHRFWTSVTSRETRANG